MTTNLQASQQLQDTLINQKVNAAHREAFRVKFPGAIEHCLRLTTERLQQGLIKGSNTSLKNSEVNDLAQAVQVLYQTLHHYNKNLSE